MVSPHVCVALVSIVVSVISIGILLLSFLLFIFFLEHCHQRVLKGLFIFGESVNFPGEVERVRIEIVFLHAILEQTETVLVIRCLFKLQLSAMVHELFEFLGLSSAQIFQACL